MLQGRQPRPQARPQGRALAVRRVLRRPPSRRVQAPDRRPRRHPVRQRERDPLAHRGRAASRQALSAVHGRCDVAVITRGAQGAVVLAERRALRRAGRAGRAAWSTPRARAICSPRASCTASRTATRPATRRASAPCAQPRSSATTARVRRVATWRELVAAPRTLSLSQCPSRTSARVSCHALAGVRSARSAGHAFAGFEAHQAHAARGDQLARCVLDVGFPELRARARAPEGRPVARRVPVRVRLEEARVVVDPDHRVAALAGEAR